LALLDVDMPKMDGIKAARLIGALSPRTKILMLSVHHEEEKIHAAIGAGALGYILKDTTGRVHQNYPANPRRENPIVALPGSSRA
jgi:DNA-binding NarL/FixJ family response regulator